MPLGWNEIRHRAVVFAKEWAGETRERAEAKSFWDGFFNVFGISRKTVADFEEPVKAIAGKYGYIDMFWPGMLLVEHKSSGADLVKAESQAFRYIADLVTAGRRDEVPRYVIVSDFARIVLYDLEPDEPRTPEQTRYVTYDVPLAELHKHIRLFAFIPGYKTHKFEDQDPINLEAVEIMGRLHDSLEGSGYEGHTLERFLVRVLFCLFAEDTGIFEPHAFGLFIENHTKVDGSDLGVQLAHLFSVLNTPENKRQSHLDEDLAAFCYVNGALFAEELGFAECNSDMRNALLACTRFDWSRISPAIFGSLFQSVMDKKERRQIGGHNTSERDILKVIRALFLDDLREEFERAKKAKKTLRDFHHKLARLRFLDPACGCGNFLVISYRELRLLELDILQALNGHGQQELPLSLVDVDAFYGIEISEWPARIAEVALWLMDHQMNLRFSEVFGQYYVRLPLKKSPTIVCGNALQRDWNEILPPEKCSYVLGNPPFVGKKEQNGEQKQDMGLLFGNVKGSGVLDYVCSWYVKAASYIEGSRIKVAFVSTNSITQGEQVGVLWKELLDRYQIKIHFAHRTFAWQSEARGKAHVHVVIVGFAAFDAGRKTIYEYENLKGEPHAVAATNINPYLADAGDVVLVKRTQQISGAPGINYGSMANDKRREDEGLGNLILDAGARRQLLAECPQIAPYIRPFMGSEEFLNNTQRWCLWLVDAPGSVIRSCPLVRARVAAVRRAREDSERPETKELAKTPTVFGEIRQPDTPYLLIPKVSSETRPYLPVGFVKPKVIANGSALIVPGATHFHLGVLSSAMHMAWMRYTCGRMKSDYQYSSRIVYNNFPWPENPTDKQRKAVGIAAQKVLDARKKNPNDTLADLYDPLSMPRELVKAHTDLDRAVDRCYRKQPFTSDRQRVEYLFALYEKLTSPLLPHQTPRRRRQRQA
ncbi:MAG: class I SAM-dependent DNA methyltransferase [Planctomycetota bacterium]|nr:class I SAM-dependent DNA methyltransferase [Planctomycetota bacterium]